jgi:hypothetical protein
MGFMMRLLDGNGCTMEVFYTQNQQQGRREVVAVLPDELRASEPKTCEPFVACGEF